LASVIIRTLIVYVLLSFSLRIMGKRQLGELDVSDLVSTLLVSEIASIPIDDPDIPLLNAVLPILFILAVEVILSTLKNKSEKLKGFMEGKPTYIIYKGRLLQSALRENRISINELLSEMRIQGVGDIDEVYYAIAEQNGSLSLILRDRSGFAHPVVIDGAINSPALKSLGYDERKIEKALRDAKISLDEVFLMTVDDDGKFRIIEREKNEGQDTCGGNSSIGHRINGGKHPAVGEGNQPNNKRRGKHRN